MTHLTHAGEATSLKLAALHAAHAIAPIGEAVPFDPETLQVTTADDHLFAGLHWTRFEARGSVAPNAVTLPELFDAASHIDLHGAIARAKLTTITRATLLTTAGAPALVTIVSFGDESDQNLAVIDTTSVLSEIADGEHNVRTRLICTRQGDIVDVEGPLGSYSFLGHAIGRWAEHIVVPESRPALIKAVDKVLVGESYARVKVAGSCPGLRFDVVVATQGDNVLVDLYDESHEHQAIATLTRAHRQFSQLSETLPVGVFVVGESGRMEFHSERLREMFGTPITTAYGWINAVCAEDRPLLDSALAALPSRRTFSVEVRALRADGELGWFRLAGSDMREPDGTLKCIVGFVEDISERRDLQQRIEFQAAFDDLTQLPNRSTVIERLRMSLVTEHSTARTGVLFIDLDGFKLINDTQGHSVGDIVLIEVAARFRRAVRARDVIGRFGGDEFIVVAPDLAGPEEAQMLAQRLHDVLGTPILADGRIITVNASVGISLSDAGGSTSEQLIGDADIAMYEAKSAGCGRTVVFDAPLRSRASQRFDMTADLRHARRRRELRLEYQPIIDLATNRLVGAEGLVRWDHPAMGRIGPSVFIPLAEEIGLIADIGEWVVEQACADLDRLRATDLIDNDFVVSINASAHQFNNVAMLATSCLASLDQYGLSPQNLRFELTESVPLTQIPDAAARIRQLTNYGFGLAIDDFGTGYSSLGYLTMLPFDVLKLDLSLIAQIHDGSPALAVVDSLTRMSVEMGFTIVAEGIETGEQQALLHAAGVQLGQGFHISRPTALSGLIDQLQKQAPYSTQLLHSD